MVITMAINTSGHRLSVIPRYTPINPSLVALDPSRAMAGMGQTLGLASMLDQIQAQRMAQDELAATRANRIEAMNLANRAKVAELNSVMPLYDKRAGAESQKIDLERGAMPQRYEIEGMRLGQQKDLIPLETNAKKAGLEFDQQHALTETGLLSDIAAARKAEAGAKKATAEQTAQNAAGRGELERVQNDLGTQLAKSVGPLANAKALADATIALSEISNDQDRKKAIQALEIALKASQIDKNKAEADYMRGLGRQSGAEKSPSARRQEILREMEALEKRTVGDGSLKAYRAEAFDEQGNPKKGFFGGEKATNPVANELVNQYVALEQELLRMGQGIQKPQAPQATLKGKAGQPKTGDVKTVMQNGQTYNVTWDGSKWVEVK